MRKVVLTVLATLSLIAIPVASVSAAPNPDYTVVSGTVTNNGKDVNNAKVTVICNNHAQKTTTDSTGYYNVAFPATQCEPGSQVSVTATKGAKGGEVNGDVSHYSADLNVAMINVSLPEMGLLTGVGASILGGGAFLIVRRRNLRASERQ